MLNNALIAQLPIDFPQEAFLAFCQKWHLEAVWLFGSVLGDDFRSESSDIDMLVSFDPNHRYDLWDWASIGDELESIFGRKVDFGSYQSVATDPNRFRRKAAILESVQVLYGR